MRSHKIKMIGGLINFLRFLAPRMALPLLTLLLLAFLARWLSTYDYASYLFYYAIAVIVSGLADGGIRDSHYFLVAKSLNKKVFKAIYKAKLIVSASLLLVGIIASVFMGGDFKYLFVVMLLAVVMPVGDVGLMILKAKNQPAKELLVGVLEGVVGLMVLAALIYNKMELGFIGALLILSSTGLVRSVFVYFMAKQFIEASCSTVEYPSRNVSIKNTAAIVGGNIYNRVPALALSGNLPVEIYNTLITMLTLVQRLELIPTAAIQAYFSTEKKLTTSPKALWKILGFIFVLSIFISVVGYFSSDFIIYIFMGERYLPHSFLAEKVLLVTPLILVGYGSRYILQLTRKLNLINIWVLICILFSFYSYYFSYTADHFLVSLGANLLLLFLGTFVILFFSFVDEKKAQCDEV
jgi:O-antigen/teichoic acid export membrane protein